MSTEKKSFVYEQIFDEISADIERGAYAYGSLLPTERQISEQYGVNRTTIRKALDILVERNYIEKRQGSGSRVIYRQANFGYRNDENAEKTIGFFISGESSKDIRLEQPFYMRLYYYLDEIFRNAGNRLLCITVVGSDDFRNVIEQYSFAGALFMTKMDPEILEYVKETGLNAVTIHNRYDGLTCITVNNIEGGYMATEYLLKRGHRNVAFITGPDKYLTSDDRWLGAREALSRYNVELERSFVEKADWTYTGGYEAMKKILGRNIKNPPTAVFAFNEEMSYGAIQALTEFDLKVPDDVSVVGFDNISSERQASSGLTMIDCGIEQIAQTAATTLTNLIDGRGIINGATIQLPVSIIEQHSVNDITGEDIRSGNVKYSP